MPSSGQRHGIQASTNRTRCSRRILAAKRSALIRSPGQPSSAQRSAGKLRRAAQRRCTRICAVRSFAPHAAMAGVSGARRQAGQASGRVRVAGCIVNTQLCGRGRSRAARKRALVTAWLEHTHWPSTLARIVCCAGCYRLLQASAGSVLGAQCSAPVGRTWGRCIMHHA